MSKNGLYREKMDKFEKALTLHEEGHENREWIGRQVGLTGVQVNKYINNESYYRHKWEEKIREYEQVEEALKDSIKISEVAEKVGMDTQRVGYILRELGLSIKDNRERVILNGLKQGDDLTVDELREKTGVSYASLLKVAKENGISLKNRNEVGNDLERRIKKADEYYKDYVRLGSITKVAERHGMTRQGISIYLRKYSEDYKSREHYHFKMIEKEEKKEKMKAWLEKEDVTREELAEKFDLTLAQVKNYTVEMGMDVETKNERARREQLRRYEEAYTKWGTIKEAAKELGENEGKVASFLSRNSEGYQDEHGRKEKEERVVKEYVKSPDETWTELANRARVSAEYFKRVIDRKGLAQDE